MPHPSASKTTSQFRSPRTARQPHSFIAVNGLTTANTVRGDSGHKWPTAWCVRDFELIFATSATILVALEMFANVYKFVSKSSFVMPILCRCLEISGIFEFFWRNKNSTNVTFESSPTLTDRGRDSPGTGVDK